MRTLKLLLLSIAIIAAIGGSGYLVYQTAYTTGDMAGYDHGYLVGEGLGYNSGLEDGYNAGEEVGYDNGYLAGETTGYNSGLEDGYTNGYTQGIEDGLGHGYTLRDPTYAEVVAFLSGDTTDSNTYVDPTYVCSHFARDAGNSAETAGFRCAFVEMRYADGGHAVIAFNTIDQGMVYFEPQHDDEVQVVIGQRYSHLNGYLPPPTNDTILDILIIW